MALIQLHTWITDLEGQPIKPRKILSFQNSPNAQTHAAVDQIPPRQVTAFHNRRQYVQYKMLWTFRGGIFETTAFRLWTFTAEPMTSKSYPLLLVFKMRATMSLADVLAIQLEAAHRSSRYGEASLPVETQDLAEDEDEDHAHKYPRLQHV